jgi:hypothetical protein
MRFIESDPTPDSKGDSALSLLLHVVLYQRRLSTIKMSHVETPHALHIRAVTVVDAGHAWHEWLQNISEQSEALTPYVVAIIREAHPRIT